VRKVTYPLCIVEWDEALGKTYSKVFSIEKLANLTAAEEEEEE